MSNEAAGRIRDLAERTLVEACWAQWAMLTASAVPSDHRRAWTIVDPEALVFASLAVGHRERRLDDPGRILGSGCRAPDELAPHACPRRWIPGRRPRATRHLHGPRHVRRGSAVEAAAIRGAAADLKVTAAGTTYTERAVRTATEEMTLAGFIHEIEGRPSSFYADPTAWANMLKARQVDGGDRGAEPHLPAWRFWAAAFVFLAQVIDWSLKWEREGWSDYVASSRARDPFENHERRLRQAQVPLPTVKATGPNFLIDFEALVLGVATWTDEGLYGGS